MNKKDKFKFEHEKPNPEIIGHHSTPETFSKLLVELLGLNQVQGQIIYDGGIGVGGLSATVDTKRNVLIGCDQERKYLKQCQKNIPSAILFNHDIFRCQKTVPCYEHLVSPQWKKKVVNYREKLINQQTDEALIFNEIQSYRGWTPEQIQEELIKKEALLKQKVLNLLIQKEAATKASINFPPPPPPPVEKEVENNQFDQIDQRVKEINQRLEEIEDDVLESDNSVCGLLKRLKKRELKKALLLEEMKKKQELLREALLYIDMSKLKNYEKEK